MPAKKRMSQSKKRMIPSAPPVNIEAMALAAKAQRVRSAEVAVLAAIDPILKKYNCRLGTVQLVVDGVPQRTEVRIVPND